MRSIALLPHAEPIADDSNAEVYYTDLRAYGVPTVFDRFRIDDAIGCEPIGGGCYRNDPNQTWTRAG